MSVKFESVAEDKTLDEIVSSKGFSKADILSLKENHMVLILPDPTLARYIKKEGVDLLRKETVTIKKLLRKQGIETEILARKGAEIEFIELREAAFDYGTFFIALEVVQTVLALIALYIETRHVKERPKDKIPTIKIKFRKLGSYRSFEIEGPADKVAKVLKKKETLQSLTSD